MVAIADGSDPRQQWAQQLLLRVLLPNLVLVAAAALAIHWAVGRAFKPLVDLAEAVEHPQLKARGLVTEVPREGAAPQRQIACPIKFSGGLDAPRHIGVKVGAHTDQVLAELGCSAERIAELRAAKVVA